MVLSRDIVSNKYSVCNNDSRMKTIKAYKDRLEIYGFQTRIFDCFSYTPTGTLFFFPLEPDILLRADRKTVFIYFVIVTKPEL